MTLNALLSGKRRASWFSDAATCYVLSLAVILELLFNEHIYKTVGIPITGIRYSRYHHFEIPLSCSRLTGVLGAFNYLILPISGVLFMIGKI